ncbi:MAG: hypothetical protein A2W19_09255 [Spirochaetes bacterium RBG_16_49_21]|nr:MAG: hypothetical protein A2W19_09255 [Spirochaetes bacterium RBG_16_49_21]
MRYKVWAVLTALLWLTVCSNREGVRAPGVAFDDVLISRGFVNDNTYRIVCKGYPLQGLEGIQKIESSKRAALLNAYYFVQSIFDDSIAPDKDGKAERFDVREDYVVVYYVITKRNLRRSAKSR